MRIVPLVFALISTFMIAAFAAPPAAAGVAEPARVAGEQTVLAVPVRFPGTQPGKTLDDLRAKAQRVDRYVRVASYDKAWLSVTVADWVDLPDPLSAYAVSPHNFTVDKRRVAKLVADALGPVRARHDLAAYKVVWIVPAVRTSFGVGYGMIAYAINPGMLSTFYRGSGPSLETVQITGGGTFSGAGIVSAENAHVGHVVHDLLHALGGATKGRRAVPDLYDFDLQSAPGQEKPTSPAPYAIHVGPWDVMSQHFVEFTQPPPMPSAFTRRQLGWIDDGQIATVAPGEALDVALAPLASGQGTLAIRVPLSPTRSLMVENRQPGPTERVVPTGGLVVMEIDTDGNEGAHGGRPIARVVDANPGTATLDDAAFVPGSGELRAYVDAAAKITITPLALGPDGVLRVRIAPPAPR